MRTNEAIAVNAYTKRSTSLKFSVEGVPGISPPIPCPQNPTGTSPAVDRTDRCCDCHLREANAPHCSTLLGILLLWHTPSGIAIVWLILTTANRSAAQSINNPAQSMVCIGGAD
eukprot:2118615-Rhodomonas_salina.1